MLLTLIRKEIMHHILSVRFIVLLLMCLLLVPLTLSINYQHYRQNLVDYQEAVKLANIEEIKVNPTAPLEPEVEVSKLFLKPTPLSVFVNGLGDALPSYLGMTRNGVTQGSSALVSASLSYLLGHLDFLFLVGTVFSLLALLFTFDAVAGEREAGTLRITLANSLPRDLFLWSKLIGGYIVFVVPFLVSFLFGLLLLVAQGFPLGEPEIFPRVLSLTLVSLIYIAVFFRGRDSNFHLLGQFQNSTYRCLYRVGVCCSDYTTRWISHRQTHRTNTNFTKRLYGKNCNARGF